jgi:hypothetical protein
MGRQFALTVEGYFFSLKTKKLNICFGMYLLDPPALDNGDS